MQTANPNSFGFSSGQDLASQNVLIQGLSMNPSNQQAGIGGFMQNQQQIGYPMFDQSMQGNFQAQQANLGMNQYNPMLMQQNIGHQLQGFGMQQNPMSFQMQQQLMNSGNAGMMSSLGDQMNPYGSMNPLLAQNQLQSHYGNADCMNMMLQGMMGSQRGNNIGDGYNNRGGGINQRFNNNNNNNQNNDTALRLNTVYISDLPQNVDHNMIRDNFSKVGTIKLNSKSGMPMIWIFKDRGVPKGDALVTFDSNSSATHAITHFKENDFNGRTIDVRIATNSERPILAPPGNAINESGGGDSYNSWAKNDWSNNRQRGDFRNNARPNNDKNRGPDWICGKCNNNNFSWRDSCNRCQEPKGDDGNDGIKQQRGFSAGGRSNNRMVVTKNSSGGGGRNQDGGPMRGPKRDSSRPGPY